MTKKSTAKARRKPKAKAKGKPTRPKRNQADARASSAGRGSGSRTEPGPVVTFALPQVYNTLLGHVFGRSRLVIPLMKMLFPSWLLGRVDLRKAPKRLSGEFVEVDGRTRRCDALFEIPLKPAASGASGGRGKRGVQEILLWLDEGKSTPEWQTVAKQLEYGVGALRQFWSEPGRDPSLRGAPVPVLLSQVLYNGASRRTMPVSLAEASGRPAGSESSLAFKIDMFDLGRYDDPCVLTPDPELRAVVISLWVRARGKGALTDRLLDEVVKGTVDRSDFQDYIMLVLRLEFEVSEKRIEESLRRVKPKERKRIMDKQAAELIKKGMIEGEAKGEVKGKAELLLDLLGQRFGKIAPTIQKRVKAASAADIDAWAMRIFDASSPESVLGGKSRA